MVTYSQHYCTKCRTYFNADLADLAPPDSHYTHRVIDLAVRLVVEDGLPYRPASWHLWRDHRVFVPFATLQWEKSGSDWYFLLSGAVAPARFRVAAGSEGASAPALPPFPG